MECFTIANSESAPAPDEDKELKNSESAENFQHFIYELFEKNGILNDLRAYLRGHIVEVLKNAQTGAPPTCQQHFTQRLELTNQALNMLVAEYLLRYDFSYSLSVFVTEIPLANMVFGLAKSFMLKGDSGDHSKLWFSESDVWAVLNYLGIKCDSEHANNIVEKYKNRESPLLLCILKYVPLYKQNIPLDQGSSMESISSEKSSESLPEKHAKWQKERRHDKCKHHIYCKSCQSRLHNIKEKYVKKKKYLSKNSNPPSPPAGTQNLNNLMKDVGFTEKTLIDEMFHQLKGVYETEVEMVKVEEEKKYKQVLATYAAQLQRRQTEMEETFKQRETDLEIAVQQKKKFLWGLAQALRDQHQNMAAAMSCVRGESEKLTAKEDNLKSQLQQAENIIRSRGEEMREQISKEIVILEGHLESIKKERNTIDKEKSELETFKALCESKTKLTNDDSQFETLKKEIVTLKKYVEEKRCVAEKCTMTDVDGGKMNNQEVGRSDSEERVGRAPNQVVNDLKKLKNVNFEQPQMDTTREEGLRARSHSTEGFEEQTRRDAILVLQDENHRLKHFARQQELHIDELTLQTARLQAELEASRMRTERPRTERPRTAPAVPTGYEVYEPRVNTSYSETCNKFSLGRGAGEQLVFSAGAAPADRRADSRRYLIQQWRALRRSSPPGSRCAEPHPAMPITVSAPSASHVVDTEPMRETADHDTHHAAHEPQYVTAERAMPAINSQGKARNKSPKTVLKEAKQKLRNKDAPRNLSQFKREKSPNSVLREAKLRLRKLEIEAEAVEKSYMDFRKRQTIREERKSQYAHAQNTGKHVTVDKVRSRSLINFRVELENENTHDIFKCKRDLDTFLSNYEKKFNMADLKFKSANDKAKATPKTFIDVDKENTNTPQTYLETPLIEFRKLYSQKSPPSKLEQKKAKNTIAEIRSKNKDASETEDRKEAKLKESPIKRKDTEVKELLILKDNINKIYNLQEPKIEIIQEGSEESQLSNDKNLLRIEVENVVETNDLKLKESSQDLFLVVQSSAEVRNISNSDLEDDKSAISPQMTVVVSPKCRNEESDVKSQDQSSNIPVRLEEPEKLAVTRDVLDSIFHVETVSIPVIPEGGSQDFLESIIDKVDDYVDDFSADVDNYNSRSEYNTSPVSHLKTSEEESFWE